MCVCECILQWITVPLSVGFELAAMAVVEPLLVEPVVLWLVG